MNQNASTMKLIFVYFSIEQVRVSKKYGVKALQFFRLLFQKAEHQSRLIHN